MEKTEKIQKHDILEEKIILMEKPSTKRIFGNFENTEEKSQKYEVVTARKPSKPLLT